MRLTINVLSMVSILYIVCFSLILITDFQHETDRQVFAICEPYQ
jgi:hypothetical protein